MESAESTVNAAARASSSAPAKIETVPSAVPAGRNRAVRKSGRGRGSFLSHIPFLIVGLVVSIAGVLLFQTWEVRHGEAQTQYVHTASNMLVLAERIAREGQNAVRGDADAYVALDASQNEFSQDLAVLHDVDRGVLGVGSAPVRVKLVLVDRVWEETRRRIESVLRRQSAVIDTRGEVARINENTPLLLSRGDEVVEQVIVQTGDPGKARVAARQPTLGRRIAADIVTYAQGGEAARAAAERIRSDTELFANTSEKIRSWAGPDVVAAQRAVDAVFADVAESASIIQDNSDDFFAAHKAAELVTAGTRKVIAALKDLIGAYQFAYERRVTRWLSWVSGVFSLVFLVLLGRAFVVNARRRAERIARHNLETQDAILKLLDEMGNLADGDLTIEAEVTDQITGAIADSVNFAVKEMRELVQRINLTSQHIAQESERTSASAQRLSDASAKQAEYINRTTEQVQAMAESMSEMATEAQRSTEVAKSSVEVADAGAKAVRDTVHGMTEMRQQIQQTSKRIKRLGESSQQIGEIVALIEDLAERTNILSMNAAIQAGMAGDAGRGFTVVADEVQQLAERSAEATKQITQLVKNIQFDTNEAVTSMEQATRGVVEGTSLADAAGRALVEIETVSENLAKLIAQIQAAARDQSQKATDVSNRMTKIRGVSTATSRDARRTARAIDQLTVLAQRLRESVARFKIPVRDDH